MKGSISSQQFETFLTKKVKVLSHEIEIGLILSIALSLIYTLIFSYVTILRYYAFEATGWDLGIFMQVMWNTVHGKPFYYTYELNVVPSGNFLALHFSPILLLVVPFYALFPRAETLLILQSSALGFGAVPLYLLAKKVLNQRLIALTLATVYLLYPPLQGINWFDFHPEAFLVPLLLLVYYAVESNNIGLLYTSVALALSVDEYAPVIVASVLVIKLLKMFKIKKIRVHLMILTILSMIYFIIALNVSKVLGLSGAGETSTFRIQQWSNWGTSLPEIALNISTHPLQALIYMATPSIKILYIPTILAPIAFLPIFDFLEFLPILAWVIPALLSHSQPFQVYLSIYSQYPSFIVAQVFASSVYGIKYLFNNSISPRLASSLLMLGLVFSMFLSPLGLAGVVAEKQGNTFLAFPNVTEHDVLLEKVIDLIPPNASVLTQNNILPHVSNRECVLGGYSPKNVVPEYVLIDITNEWSRLPVITGPLSPQEPSIVSFFYNYLDKNYSYGLYASVDGILLYKLNYKGEPVLYVPYDRVFLPKDMIIANGSFYGPYTCLPPGTFNITFTLYVPKPVKQDTYVITLDVSANDGQEILASRPLYGLDLKEGYDNITLTVSTDKPLFNVEFRGLNPNTNVSLSLVKVYVKQLSYRYLGIVSIGFPGSSLDVGPAGEVVDGKIVHEPGMSTGNMWYGPYIPLKPGKYNITFALIIRNATKSNVMYLDVVYDLGKITLANTTVHIYNFTQLNKTQFITLTIEVKEPLTDVEFRGFVTDGNAWIELLYIEVNGVAYEG
jgi:uncharacterized membrane protein